MSGEDPFGIKSTKDKIEFGLLTLRYNYHGMLNIYYGDKRIHYMDYVTIEDKYKAYRWVNDLNEELKINAKLRDLYSIMK